ALILQINPAAGISAALIYAGYILFDIISIMRHEAAHFGYTGKREILSRKKFNLTIKALTKEEVSRVKSIRYYKGFRRR
ncbi:MAG: hypothetical protein NUW09_04175, partial [Deltaproteobacteria bacterium]|nr:hypothetical protein [Deltaproteobacteria bacterium]